MKNPNKKYMIQMFLGIHNRKYLDKYIDDHYEEITNGSYLFGLVNINNYDNLILTMEEDIFNEIVLAYKNEIKILVNSASQIFEYDESSLVLLYNLYLNDDELVNQHQVYTGKEIQNNIDFDDIHFTSKTGVIRLNKAFAFPYIIKSNIDNATSFLKKDAENSFTIFGNELWDKLIYQQEVQNSLSKSNDTLFDKEFYLVFQPKVDSKKIKSLALKPSVDGITNPWFHIT